MNGRGGLLFLTKTKDILDVPVACVSPPPSMDYDGLRQMAQV